MDQIDRWPGGGDFYPEDYYEIEPYTILETIDKGKINIFTPTDEPFGTFWPENAVRFHWSQSDFVKIATSLNQFAGKDNISEWNLLIVSFIAECGEDSGGFSTGHFIVFRPTWKIGQLYYQAREIYINPLVSIVRWGDERNYPRPILGWEHISLDEFNYSADEALAIAEENGGNTFRYETKNACQIDVIGRDNEWIILYSAINGMKYNEYRIDPFTGTVKYFEEFEK